MFSGERGIVYPKIGLKTMETKPHYLNPLGYPPGMTFSLWTIKLGGGFKHFLFSPRNPGEMIQFNEYVSNGLVQPPTRKLFSGARLDMLVLGRVPFYLSSMDCSVSGDRW